MIERLRKRGKDRGASLVEFALVAPLLFLLLFGMIEFGWGMAQQVDIRHKAREALRVAIVDGTEAQVEARVCADDLISASDVTSILRGGGTDVGDDVTVTIEANFAQLTGLFGWVWGSNPTISSSVEGRVEQEATAWLPGEELAPC
jgi:Flp pilus assembly protein TadG